MLKPFLIALFLFASFVAKCTNGKYDSLKIVLEKTVLAKANAFLKEKPITITADRATRSAGNVHDFYSEGDYWWPNPNDLNGAYIQKDGLTNPDNFVAHRKAMIRFRNIVGTLASAYIITKNERYVTQAFKHLNAWFVDTATLMNPSLLYAQAIKGKATGRSIGVIDMIQMMEVAQGVSVMQHAKLVNKKEVQIIKNWFSQYLKWVTIHAYGVEESAAKNNHGTCWVMQVAVFAKLVGNDSLLNDCSNRFKNELLPNQMAVDGSFPLELKRTKPYGYSLFNVDAMATICQVLSTPQNDLWRYKLSNGKGMQDAVNFMYQYVANKEAWPYPKDVMYWDEWPIAQPFLVFGAYHFNNNKWFKVWQGLNHFPDNEEVIRNVPVRNPLLWVE